ncbi:transmembrane emp24 domain-containing protein 3 [Patella vulgata]|uniref:transmembrane emp24 domain-containing protein 3 n=1 Tax=Patella vulgata TaxID=6465 RepID=UPI0024A831CC|nr:transmembrane emp24 domain-containing protein 3 [Patella vulgata]
MLYSRNLYLSVVLLCVTYLELALGVGYDYTFELEDNAKTCFSEIYDESQEIIFEYKVIRGGKLDVDAKVISPNGKILYKQRQKQFDTFELEPQNGEFKFCFSNEFSTISHKVIFFSIRPKNVKSLSGQLGLKVPTVKSASETSMDNINEYMTAVVDFQRIYRLKEAIGRHLGENLGQRVMWWSVFQTIIIVSTGFGQVLILKFLFTEKRRSSKQNEQ